MHHPIPLSVAKHAPLLTNFIDLNSSIVTSSLEYFMYPNICFYTRIISLIVFLCPSHQVDILNFDVWKCKFYKLLMVQQNEREGGGGNGVASMNRRCRRWKWWRVSEMSVRWNCIWDFIYFLFLIGGMASIQVGLKLKFEKIILSICSFPC